MKIISITVALLISMIVTSPKGPDKTVRNLQDAFQDEANTIKRYELYAQRASAEGYSGVARLFRVVSASENIHLRNHKEALKRLGKNPPSIKYEIIEIGSTKDNLKESIRDESRKEKYTYLQFALDAKKEAAEKAKESFVFAMIAEEEHKNLFSKALKNLEKDQLSDYYVSDKTGATIAVPLHSSAPFAQYEDEQFIRIE